MSSVAGRLGAGALVLGALLAGSCARPTAGPRGVILIVLDTVRSDHLGCYGYHRATSPNLDALAARGVRFEQVVAPAPWTLPSVASLLAGGHAERAFEGGRLGISAVQSLRQAGIRTAAFTEGGFVSRHFDMDLGFDAWHEEEGAVQFRQPGEPYRKGAQGGIERTFDHATKWLAGLSEGRFFLLIHTYEPHAPYTSTELAEGLDPGRIGPVFTLDHGAELRSGALVLTESEIEYVTALYDGDIASADRHVGRLLDRLEELGLADEVAVVVTSDHGEDLDGRFPRHRFDHGHALLDEQVLVPLIVHDPTRTWPVSLVEPQVRTIDVLPTVAELLDVPLETPLEGSSLLPLMAGEASEERPAVMGNVRAGPMRMGLRALGYKYIRTLAFEGPMEPLSPEPPPAQLYDLGADPREERNLAGERQPMVDTLDATLLERIPRGGVINAPGADDDLDPRLLERLRSLGYVR